MNERTDLTQTEVSPRGHVEAEVYDRPSGKVIKINTRVIKLSQELKSIKMLNIKGSIQTKRNRDILRLQSANSAKNNNSLNLAKQTSNSYDNSSSNGTSQLGINFLRQNLLKKQSE